MIDEPSRPGGPGWPVLDWIDDGCLLFDQRLDCLYANKAGSALFGLAPDQLVGRSLHSPFPTALASEFQRAALPAVANRTSTRTMLHDESTARWLAVAMYPSSDGLLAIVADVTETTRAELELAAHSEYLQQLVDQVPAFLWVIDRELVVRRIEGGRPMLKTLVSRPIRLRTKRGVWKSVALTLTDLRRDTAVRGVVVSARDVTRELALESQLRQSQKVEAIGQLASGVAHDFNNVLAAISGYVHLLQGDFAADDPRDELDEIMKAVERAASITRQLLAFSRQQIPAPARLDLVEVVHELSRMLRALLPATIALHVSPERGGPSIHVLADRSQLELVVMNLAVNARDAMPAGGTLSVEVRTGMTPETAPTAVIEVRDTGSGMSPEVQARVFEPFFTTKEAGRGTGLGLATVSGIVRQHSGSIEIASAVGEGTTVIVRLPVAAAGADPAVHESEPAARDHGGRVLVIEDQAQVREAVARSLQRAGYQVRTASDARKALDLLTSAEAFDLVLTDSAMPGMHGEDFADEISRVQPTLPVIVMSGYRDPERPPTSNAVAAFIQKPFTMPALLAEVRRVIAGSL